MANTATTDRKATADEVRAHAQTLRDLAARSGLETPRLRDDGTIVVGSSEPGYRRVLEFAGQAATVVGAYVHVITDDAPAAQATSDL
jgi:hypothetical protein